MVDAILAEPEAVAVVKVEHNLGMFPTEALGIINSTPGPCNGAESGWR